MIKFKTIIFYFMKITELFKCCWLIFPSIWPSHKLQNINISTIIPIQFFPSS